MSFHKKLIWRILTGNTLGILLIVGSFVLGGLVSKNIYQAQLDGLRGQLNRTQAQLRKSKETINQQKEVLEIVERALKSEHPSPELGGK